MYDITRRMWRTVIVWQVFGLALYLLVLYLVCCTVPEDRGEFFDLGIYVLLALGSIFILVTFTQLTLKRRFLVTPDSMTMQWLRKGRVTQEIVYTIPLDARVVVDARWFNSVIYILDPATEKIDRFFVVQQCFRNRDAKAAARVLRNAEVGRDAAKELETLIKKPGVDNIGDSLFRLDGKLYEADLDYD